MRLQQEFILSRPRATVWAFFKDVPSVAQCLPGAEYLGQAAEGRHTGKMSMKVGPFQASFEGEADVTYDNAAHKVSMSGKGVDKKGASRGKMVMDCSIFEEAGKTRVTIDADVQLSGAIAQFGRTGIIQEIAGVLISDFVRNVEVALSEEAGSHAAEIVVEAARNSRPISGTRLLWLSVRSIVLRLFGSRA